MTAPTSPNAGSVPQPAHEAPALEPKNPVRGRLAPSPTGLAHLGNAWAFLMAWLSVRSRGGELVLRMEDLDLERTSVIYMQMLMSDIRWLGLDWDEGPTPERAAPDFHQSNRFHLYAQALETLRAKGLCYPCFCTRKDLMIAHAPHLGDAGYAYPGTCRHLPADVVRQRMAREPHCWRFAGQGREYGYQDMVLGPCQGSIEASGGDFSLQRADGVYAYQLAVSVDDGLMGITEVVRGRDILPSTVRQLAILEALDLPAPAYGHIPLLIGLDGERLAKRHASMSLDSLRQRGVSPWRVTGLLAFLAGLTDRLEIVHPKELVPSFDLATIGSEDRILTAAHLDWLEGKTLQGDGTGNGTGN